MFRKDDSTISAWYPQKPDDCGKIQREIVTQAVKMLSPGGQLMYSTCTFAPEEDEEIVRFILNRFPQMKRIFGGAYRLYYSRRKKAGNAGT